MCYFGAAVGICFTVLVILLLIYVFPMHFMHSLDSGRVEGTDIIAIKNRINNLFFIPSDKGWIVIDAGSDAKLVKQEMGQLSIDGYSVKCVFLTHTDYDHVASISLFPNATIYMSEQEQQMIDGSTNRQFFKKNSLPKLSDSNKIQYLQDNEVIEIHKHKVCIIKAPGHTKGSAMYLLDEKYLFTGDAFKITGNDISVHPYTMDKKQAQETIYGIKGELRKYEKVFTAHYGLLKLN